MSGILFYTHKNPLTVCSYRRVDENFLLVVQIINVQIAATTATFLFTGIKSFFITSRSLLKDIEVDQTCQTCNTRLFFFFFAATKNGKLNKNLICNLNKIR